MTMMRAACAATQRSATAEKTKTAEARRLRRCEINSGRKSGVRINSPLLFVLRDLFRGGMLRLNEGLHLELIHDVHHSVVQVDIVFEQLGHRRLLEDRLPRALGLARAAIDAFVGMDVELIGKLLGVSTGVLVDAVHRADADTSGIDAIATKPCNRPRHRLFLS